MNRFGLVTLLGFTLISCQKEKTMRVDLYGNCADCTMKWSDTGGYHEKRIAGTTYVEHVSFEAPEDFIVSVTVCPTYPDSLRSAGCWIKIDGVPSGFVANGDSLECVSVSH